MLLDRCLDDCKYFLGYGNGCEKHLYYGNIPKHIDKMKEIFNNLSEKPEWTSMEEIEKYELEMNVLFISKKLLNESSLNHLHECMIKMNHLWIGQDGNFTIPSKEEIRVEVKHLIREILRKSNYKNERTELIKGGIQIVYDSRWEMNYIPFTNIY
jgi:hypothetical protein